MLFFIFLIVIILFLAYLTSPSFLGKIGESRVSDILSSLPPEKYILINDCMIPTNRGTTQIDHILVSIYGIFVIETKNYSGWITGGEYSEKWVKNMYGKKYEFQNPLKQNYGHVLALKSLTQLPDDYFIPIVVFTNQAEIKVSSRKPVIKTNELKRTILNYNSSIISFHQVKEIAQLIYNANITDFDARQKHISDIRENIATEKRALQNGICPKCGGRLVKKNGKYGMFWGCSNYPKCRFTTK